VSSTLLANTSLTLQQVDTIFSLVSIAENSTTKWWNNYAYCENIGDGRGLTVSIVGFCSGTSDLLWVVKRLQVRKADHPLVKYLPALQAVDGSARTTGLEKFASDLTANNDTYWKQAVWDGIIYFYWTPAVQWATKMGLKSALSIGQLYDTALNHGSEVLSKFSNRIKAATPSAGGSEATWMGAFLDTRQYNIQYEDKSTNNGQPDRVVMWRSVLTKNNLALTRPITGLVCYGESFTIA
jgi:chitosanase